MAIELVPLLCDELPRAMEEEALAFELAPMAMEDASVEFAAK